MSWRLLGLSLLAAGVAASFFSRGRATFDDVSQNGGSRHGSAQLRRELQLDR